MFSASKGQDFLDTLFSGRRSEPDEVSNSKLRLIRPAPTAVRSSERRARGGDAYPDKIRNKVKSLKKHRKRDAILKSITADSAFNNTNSAYNNSTTAFNSGNAAFHNTSIAFNYTSTSSTAFNSSSIDDLRMLYDEETSFERNNTSTHSTYNADRHNGPDRNRNNEIFTPTPSVSNAERSVIPTEKNILSPLSENANLLRTYAADFSRCCALRDSFEQQLNSFFLHYLQPVSQFQMQLQGMTARPAAKETRLQRQQFFLLVIALRKNNVRVVESYQKVSFSFSRDLSDQAQQTLQNMRKHIRNIADNPLLSRYPEPFSSWLTVTPHRNLFFTQNKIDGTAAATLRDKGGKRDSRDNRGDGERDNSQSKKNSSTNNDLSSYPSELHMSLIETEKMEILGSFVWEIVGAVRLEEINEIKNRKKKEIFDSFLLEDDASDPDRDDCSDNNDFENENKSENHDQYQDENQNEYENNYHQKESTFVRSPLSSPPTNRYSTNKLIGSPVAQTDVERDHFILVGNKCEKNILRKFWDTWENCFFMGLKMEGMKKCRDRNVKEKVGVIKAAIKVMMIVANTMMIMMAMITIIC